MSDHSTDPFLQNLLAMGDRGETPTVELWLDRFIEIEAPRHPRRVIELLLRGAAPRQREDRWEALDREKLFIAKLLTAYRKGRLEVCGPVRQYLNVMCAAPWEYLDDAPGETLPLSDALDELYTDRKIEEDGIRRCADLLLELYTGKPSSPPPARMDEEDHLLEDGLLYSVREEHPTLWHILRHEKDETLRAGTVLALAETEGEKVLPCLVYLLWREKEGVAWACVEAMARIGTEPAMVQVRRVVFDHLEDYARVKATEMLAGGHDDADIRMLTQALESGAPLVRFVAAKSLLMRTLSVRCAPDG